jgi:hypothetical protein
MALDVRSSWMRRALRSAAATLVLSLGATATLAQAPPRMVCFDHCGTAFPLAASGRAATIYLAPQDAATLSTVVSAFADDVERVSGTRPQIVSSLDGLKAADVVIVGTAGHLPRMPQVATESIAGQWETALTTVVSHPTPAIARALVVEGSDRRGAAFALFTLSRQMGVSPWYWWADVPVAHHTAVYIAAANVLQPSPSVQYRGIFLNDEDWGLRPWAAAKMDPSLHHIGPRTYERVFELLLRLHANSLWPAMHPGTLAFNAVPENAQLADKWGIVMGSSHSEALLRNNVGEWSEAAPPQGDGKWNYQINSHAMQAYWDQRLAANGKFENFYTVGLRGVHDTGLEATGDDQVKARLVEQVLADQRALLASRVNPDLAKVPQVIWLYKESLELYRAGMKVPPDVTLGWTDDNYGYIRQLPTVAEQQRPGGSGLYYHVSYWGFPHDYLWLCSTPPALMREELTKAYDRNVRRYWVLNVGDLKPAESDIDYFMQLASDEPAMAKQSQREFLARWFAEQFPSLTATSTLGDVTRPGYPVSSASKSAGGSTAVVTHSTISLAEKLADVVDGFYQLDFTRKPEFMGFNGYNDNINRTAFNPLAWGETRLGDDIPFRSYDVVAHNTTKDITSNQNDARSRAWSRLVEREKQIGETLPKEYASAYFELVAYPVQAAAAMNEKFLATDLTYLDAHQHDAEKLADDTARAKAAFDRIGSLTAEYNALEGGKWAGMMSDAPRQRHVFEMPAPATMQDADKPLPASWGTGDPAATVSINAAHFTAKFDGSMAQWHVLPELGISGGSVEYGAPGLLANEAAVSAKAEMPWLEYAFTTSSAGPATVAVYALPTFPVDSAHTQRFAIALDGANPQVLDSGSTGEWHEDTAPVWAANVLRNAAVLSLPVAQLAPGKHTLRIYYVDPGVVFEHILITLPGAAPGYPVPPETQR